MSFIRNHLSMVSILTFVGLVYLFGTIAIFLPWEQFSPIEIMAKVIDRLIYETNNPPRYGWNFFLLPLLAGVFLLLYLLGNLVFRTSQSITLYIVIIIVLLLLTIVGFIYGDGIVFVAVSLVIQLFAIPSLGRSQGKG